jgi:DNA-binding transcriptional LysR family regulator
LPEWHSWSGCRESSKLWNRRDGVKSAASGFQGQLRIALSDGITPSRLPALLARCREEEPEVEIRLFEVPLDQQIKGCTMTCMTRLFDGRRGGRGIVVTPAWEDELMVAVPARHPVLASSTFRWKKCCAIRWRYAIRRCAKAMRARLIAFCSATSNSR